MPTEIKFSVSEFIDVCNQSLDYAFADVIVEGEVASFKVNQGKWVFFDLKEEDSSISCFMVISQLKMALQDGMKVQVKATPRLTRWGKFSLTVRQILPVGEGSIKKNFELLKKKLTAEGLFDPERKRLIPQNLTKIAVISSTSAAGYIDFLKILSNRWGGLSIQTINTQVQGISAPEQIIRALNHFNQLAEAEVIVIVRGGGSADDLSAFNDEGLVRAIAASRIPVMTGIGHEIDESLADLAADVRASTPSNAAERLTSDRQEIIRRSQENLLSLQRFLLDKINLTSEEIIAQTASLREHLLNKIEQAVQRNVEVQKILNTLNPENVLQRGYAMITGKPIVGEILTIITSTKELTAEVKNVQTRK